MFIRIAFAVVAAALLSACNPMAQLEQSETKIEKWHATYNEGDARTLYGLTSQEFRDVTSIDEMNQLVALVTDKMGKVSSSERAGFNINTNNGVTSTVVTMKTVFEKGEGTETFTFRGNGDDTRLVGWNVDSPNFVAVPTDAITLPERIIEGEPEAAPQ
ncbi:hypothetical protein [Erythrobacter aurantius]|uniref:hypothetical protein n=1 Tax=Erythrobacter aurantius TaxID=2909249 RepID=UPI002079305F|nr:hypothetical protein [Erythrobacter aurantius]